MTNYPEIEQNEVQQRGPPSKLLPPNLNTPSTSSFSSSESLVSYIPPLPFTLPLSPSIPVSNVIFRHHSPPPSSDAESDLSNHSHTAVRRKVLKSRKKVSSKEKLSKSSKSISLHKMTKDLNSKKAKSKDKKDEKESRSDSNEDDDKKEISFMKKQHKSKVKLIKCNHKHPKTKSACYRCIRLKQKKSFEVKKTDRNKKKSKINSNKKSKYKSGKRNKNSRNKTRKGQPKEISDDEVDSSLDQFNQGDISEQESDATQEEDEDCVEESLMPHTIADLIKCSNRREAVRKAAARAAMASVNSRSKVSTLYVNSLDCVKIVS